jgi:hypothetical protein
LVAGDEEKKQSKQACLEDYVEMAAANCGKH